jgi:hypothetical protein
MAVSKETNEELFQIEMDLADIEEEYGEQNVVLRNKLFAVIDKVKTLQND